MIFYFRQLAQGRRSFDGGHRTQTVHGARQLHPRSRDLSQGQQQRQGEIFFLPIPEGQSYA